ncbi:MAG TPA: glycerol-3-phosphate dehydrogenase/oxidase [Gemmatimonadaceae bacterium]|nr:glycerol-3-phosphate dehydrogenase/oxidase [Gemmatimonadaceae bacterium]
MFRLSEDDPTTVHATRPDRADLLRALGGETFDVLVVGGGITGAGVARDAALRGLRTALVERHDYASGTSSRSSRLVHGGVRYLEHGQLGLVFESSRERRTLMRIAPHLVRPLAFTWPVYRGARLPRWKLAAGLALYDALSLFRNRRHERLSAMIVHAREPELRTDALLGGARYWDAATDDVRLTLATVRSAQRAGTVALNHVTVTELLRDGARVTGAHALDTLDGADLLVRARVVVNAAGPWSDQIERMAEPDADAGVRGSKGVHVSVARARVGNVDAVTLTAPQDGRVMFVLPSGAHTIIGTTDTYDAGSPDEVHATASDVRYLLDAANHYFPEARLGEDDVVSAWAGIRPLAAQGATGAASSASREHSIVEHVPGLVRVTGGKLTTYRSMAAEVTDAVERSLGRTPTPSRTAALPLAGGEIHDAEAEIAHAVATTGDEALARRLVGAHGSEWHGIWSLTQADPALGGAVEPGLPYRYAELLHAVTHEQAATVGDLLIRRTPLAFETRDHGRSAARRLAPTLARWLRWTREEMEEALAAYEAEATRLFRITPD